MRNDSDPELDGTGVGGEGCVKSQMGMMSSFDSVEVEALSEPGLKYDEEEEAEDEEEEEEEEEEDDDEEDDEDEEDEVLG